MQVTLNWLSRAVWSKVFCAGLGVQYYASDFQEKQKGGIRNNERLICKLN